MVASPVNVLDGAEAMSVDNERGVLRRIGKKGIQLWCPRRSRDARIGFTVASVLGATILSLLPSVSRGQCGYPAEVLADAPAMYFRFEEASGPTALDSSGYGRHGTYYGPMAFNADGIQNGLSRAASFSSSFVEVSNGIFAGPWPPALTVEAWVRIAQPTNDFAAVVSSTTRSFLHFQLCPPGPACSYGVNAAYTNRGQLDVQIFPQLSDNLWHHLVIVFASESTQCYFDGTPFGPAIATPFDYIFPPQGGYINIGRGFEGGRYLHGSLDEVAIYQSGLPARRVADHYFTGINAPGIFAQPQSTVACSGGVTFSLTPAGAAPFGFQWRKGGTPIDTAANPSAATATLTLTNISTADAASYDCIVTNTCGSVTSNPATLTVNAGPAIATPPSDARSCPIGRAAFTVDATGTAPLSHQWQLEAGTNNWINANNGGLPYNGGTIIASGVTTDQLSLDINALPGAPGIRFRCVVTNLCGSVTSNPATLIIQPCMACSLADIAGGGSNGLSPDGIVDGADFIAFINSFSTGDPAVDALADVAGGGADGLAPDGIIDGNDFIAFINAFAAGC